MLSTQQTAPVSKQELLNVITKLKKLLTSKEAFEKRYNWRKLARPSQRFPKGNEWKVWLIMAGRGFGKTRTGAETIRSLVSSQKAFHIALIGQSIMEAKSVMVFGESGLLNVFPKEERPIYCDTEKKIFFKNGAIATLFGGNMPERLRGPQFDFVWIDEIAKFRNPEELFNQVMMCLRLGKNPRAIITTTPRPIPFLEKLREDPLTITSTGTTFENEKNLAKSYIEQMKTVYAHTTLGRQELYAELLSHKQGALWRRDIIKYKAPPHSTALTTSSEGKEDHSIPWRRIVIAIDPATTHHEQSDETGIIVAGLHEDGLVYVLDDLSGKHSPSDWGSLVTKVYWHYKADRVVAEINKGGDLVEKVVKSIDPHISYRAVRATRGKVVRAEPVSALYEQGKIMHHRCFHLLEDQLCSYLPGISSKSPDRMDALVWAITDLLLSKEASLMPKVWG